MPTPRSEIAAAALDGQIYVAGGMLFPRGNASDAFEIYDPASDTWTEAASLPVAVHHAAMTATEDHIYLTGGYDSLDFRPDIASLWAYDPAIDQWIIQKDMPAPRAAHALVALDGKIYVVGGVGPGSDQLWAYDPATNTWDTHLAPLPTPREHLTATAFDGRLYAISGRWQGINLPTVEVYDPTADSWQSLADIPTARSGLTSATVAGRIHVTGGEALRSTITFDQHEVYDPISNRWSTLDPLPVPRHGLTSAVIADHWVVIGGATGAGALTTTTLTAAVHIFDPAINRDAG